MFGSINKTFIAAAKFLVAATKILFVVPNFVAVTKPFFFCAYLSDSLVASPEAPGQGTLDLFFTTSDGFSGSLSV